MCAETSDNYFHESLDVPDRFEQVRGIVESEFEVEARYIEHGVPTFEVRLRDDSKEAFLRLFNRTEKVGLVPSLKRRAGKHVLRVFPKPTSKRGSYTLNIVLFFATLATVFLSGYLTSGNIEGSVMFTAAIMAILGSHEFGHKLLADRHKIDATYPYFIPGLPPVGTFGAVIRQKSLAPNRDALFDTGFGGPVAGLIVSIIVILIGVNLSVVVSELPPGSVEWPYPDPLLFDWLITFALTYFPPSGTGNWILIHPIVFAGWVGLVVTVLNLVPVGMFDGGHVVRSLVGEGKHKIISYGGIALLAIISYPMALLALFLSFSKHPGSLDDVSEPTTRRKLGGLALIAVFILCVTPISPLI